MLGAIPASHGTARKPFRGICWGLAKTAHSWRLKIAHLTVPVLSRLAKPTGMERREMHDWGTRMRLRYYLEQGMSKTELSRRFGVSRRTIHYWIESGQLDRDLIVGGTRYPARPAVAHKLDPYKPIIAARLEQFPKLSAQRLFDEVRAAGYTGDCSAVRDYVRETRPRESLEEPVRFETPPGRQGQVDFGTFRFPWGRRHALVVVLGYSRLLWLRFYPHRTMAVLVDGLESASRASVVFLGSCCSIRCAPWWCRTSA